MLAFEKHIENVRGYRSVNVTTIQNKIEARANSYIQKTGIKADLFEISDVTAIFNNKEFEKRYGEELLKILQDGFSQSGGKISGMNDLFSPNSSIRLTSKIFDLSREDLPVQLDNLIVNLKGVINAAFPNGNGIKELTAMNNSDFIKNLGTFFSNNANIGPSLAKMQGVFRDLEKSYGSIAKGDLSGLNALYGGLSKMIGEGLWELIAMQARAKTLEWYFLNVQDPIVEKFVESGATVKVSARQSGSETVGGTGKSGVVDSFVKINISGKDGSEILRVEIGDSTKFTQGGLTSFGIESMKEYEEDTIGNLLNQIGRKEYWSERMGAYLKQGKTKAVRANQKDNNGPANWENSKQAMYLQFLYDLIAVRSGGSAAQTFSINQKITSIQAMIKTMSENLAKSKRAGSIKNIFTIGGGYTAYVKNQLAISDGKTEDDEKNLSQRYSNYIDAIMATKVNISVNAWMGF